jgi:hypothetical protein
MNAYRPEVPRAASAASAVALTTLALGALVVSPTLLDSRAERSLTSAAPAAAAIEVAISPARIDVIGVRTPDVAWAVGDGSKPCKPEV